MDSQRYQRVRALFHAACELPVADRAAYLAAECAEDQQLLDEVRSLLDAAESAASFLSEPVRDVAKILASRSLGLDGQTVDGHIDNRVEAGGRIGQYRIESVIARGGMGVVYRAMQESPHRYVALKVMRHGIASRQTLRRFHDEAEILARLRHPNIAQIFEAGTHLDRSMREGGEAIPFFAMEYIPEALTITEYAPRADLSIRHRLELFVKVCDAIHHGHQKGVIHRDIKPANILVDAAGEPKVIDFGVARSTNSDIAVTTQHTQVGQLVGTLQYMSPEQCDGDSANIDSRSDVYSLGAVLYELLSGVPALDPSSSTLIQATVMVREHEPRPLAALDRRFRGNLDAIVTKALFKRREYRYQSAEALKFDLERHLRGEPIEARPRSTWVRASYFIGRHPIVAANLATIAIAMLVFVGLVVAIRIARHHPFAIEESPDNRYAHLVTPFGRILASFGGETSSPGSVYAKFVTQPSGARAVLYSVREGTLSTDFQLRMAHARSLSKPIWQTSPAEPHAVPELPSEWDLTEITYSYEAHNFVVGDVFPASPGSEVIVVHEAVNESPNAIRVYDLAGRVLFEAWHFGYLAQVYWWRDEGLIVCAGDRHGRPDIRRFGYKGPPWPKVVFAIKPRLGTHPNWINDADWPDNWRPQNRSEDVLIWYRVLEPVDLSSRVAPIRIRAASRRESDLTCIFVSYESEILGAFDLSISPLGECIQVQQNDEFFHSRKNGSVPEPLLGDWPPPAAEP